MTDVRCSLYISASYLISVIGLVMNQLGFPITFEVLFQWGMPLVIFALVLPSLMPWFSKLLLAELFLVFELILTYLLGYARLDTITRSGENMMVIYIPLAFAGYCIAKKTVLLKIMYFPSWLAIILLTLSIAVEIRRGGFVYNQTLGYLLLFPIICMTLNIFIFRRYIDIFALIWCLFLVVKYGSRGPLLCIAALFAIMIFIGLYRCSNNVWLTLAIVLGIGCLILFLLEKVSISGKFETESRTLNILLNKEFFSYTSGRDSILAKSILLINERPWLGYGIFGSWMDILDGWPHNIFIELILSFGILMGLLCSLVLIYLVAKCLVKAFKSNEYLIAASFVIMNISLLFSGSLFSYWYFWAGLGLVLGTKSIKECANIEKKKDIGVKI